MSFDSAPKPETAAAGDAGGPFSRPVNALLGESFGESLDDISVERGQGETNRALNAKAHTIGRTISLGSDIREDPTDTASMRVIAHEVAHALAGGGSGRKLVDSGRHDAGESAAHAASDSFASFIAGGARGPAPRLSPAHGGEAMIHRYEAGEHADSVDHAAETLKAGGGQVDQKTADMMSRPITLSNGVTVTQGQVTAMMGDFYGAYTKGKDGKEHFDPAASFNALDNADPKEMKALIAKIQNEQKDVTAAKEGKGTFEPTANSDFESITNDRHLKTDANGTTTGYTFMDLAQKNTNHFNSKDESGTDNNMGAYGALHAMAMQEAQKVAAMPDGPEKDKAQQRALAMEASSQHFLTDRFSSGHQFDKQQMIDNNSGGALGSTWGNVVSRVEHDRLNETPTMVEDGQGHRWNAMGDEHWADKDNAENRVHTAQTVMNSYGDVGAIMSGDKKASDFADPTAHAHETAPKWSDSINDRAQAQGKKDGLLEVVPKEIGQVGLLPTMAWSGIKAKWHSIEDTAGEAWDWTKDKASKGWDATKEGAGEAWDYTKDKAGKAWNATKEGAGEAWDWTKDKASKGWDATKKGAGAAWDATKKVGSAAVDTVSEGASAAWDATKGAAHEVSDTVSSGAAAAWGATKQAGTAIADGAGAAWDATKQGAGEAWDATKGAASTVGNAASEGASWVGDKARGAWSYLTGG
jgi:uncharacterized protein DUF4157